jgi:hypothetical protein
MVMEPRISTQDMVGNKHVAIPHLFNRLDKGTYGTEIGVDLGLRKNGSNLHDDGSLKGVFPPV